MDIPFIEDNDQTRSRRENLEKLRGLVGNVYPNKFERSSVSGAEDTVTALIKQYKKHEPEVKEGERPAQEALAQTNDELNKVEVRISGRIATPPRVMGKAAFVHLSDGVSRLQIYVRKADVKGVHNDDGAPIEEGWELFNALDHGDFIGVTGYLFITKTGELSVHVRELQFLAKAMLPMPDKLHGIADPEIRRRHRYVDLIAGSLKVETDEGTASDELTPREVFERRSKIIREMRRFLDDHGYLEVETPMLTPKATGAIARPFETFHKALGIPLYARIAPELYLKRLLVGGFEKVYELNRNFRNEGIDRTHNPEFTMLEFYCAYMDVNGMMDFCEEMLRRVERALIEGMSTEERTRYSPKLITSDNWPRLTMKDAIAKVWSSQDNPNVTKDMLDDPNTVLGLQRLLPGAIAKYENYPYDGAMGSLTPEDIRRGLCVEFPFKSEIAKLGKPEKLPTPEETAWGIQDIFERLEKSPNALFHGILERPVFIINHPKAISPLAKASPFDSGVAERFELFVSRMECANGFSELNDPKEQYDRFLDQAQARERGDDEAMLLDEDYIRALSYGMPPAAGIGIGIDRLVMLLTNKHSIRDVILFPHMRPERKSEEAVEDDKVG